MKQITSELQQKTSRYLAFNQDTAHKTITRNEIKELSRKTGVQREPIADCNNLKYTIVQRVPTRNLSEGMFYMHKLLFIFHDFV